MSAALLRDLSTVWGVFSRGLVVDVVAPDGPDRAVVHLGGSMRVSAPVGALEALEVTA